jgi:hypothetical protein
MQETCRIRLGLSRIFAVVPKPQIAGRLAEWSLADQLGGN